MSESVPLMVKAKWPPLKSLQNGVEITLPDVEVAFETQDTVVMMATLDSLTLAMNRAESGEQAPVQVAAPEGKKPRKNAKNQPDPASASAPPPLPVPNADPNDLTIPDAFRRTAPSAPPLAVAPVPPLPGAPPIAPAPPPPPAPPNPTNALAKAVRAEVEKRGEVMLPWLVSAGAVVAGATFDEALEVLGFLTPDKLEPIARALSVSV